MTGHERFYDFLTQSNVLWVMLGHAASQHKEKVDGSRRDDICIARFLDSFQAFVNKLDSLNQFMQGYDTSKARLRRAKAKGCIKMRNMKTFTIHLRFSPLTR
jgi:hypothetical protein